MVRPSALQLHVAQGTDGRRAATGQQGVGHRGQAADGVGTRAAAASPVTSTRSERRAPRPTTARVPIICSATVSSMQLPQFVEGHAGDGDRTELRKADLAVAAHHQGVVGLDVADELHLHRVARAHRVLGRHRDVVGRREGRRHAGEQVVAEGLQRIDADGLELQQR